jgi:TonB family protein
MSAKPILISLVIIIASVTGVTRSARSLFPGGQQNSIQELEKRLRSQYAETERLFASPPHLRGPGAGDYRRMLREWQDDLAQSFVRAASIVEAILALNPPSREMWQERLETLRLYSQPVSSPDERTVYGSSEVEQPPRILQIPLAESTVEASAARIHGDVRLRVVLAADGTVKYVFPIKSLGHGLTEAAIDAARHIKFDPAQRKGKPASVFMTVVYEFDRGQPKQPYVPGTIF